MWARRDIFRTASARGSRIDSYSPSAARRSSPPASRSASTTASSIAWAAPCPTPGVCRVGSVTDQHEAALAPARERVEVVDVVAQDRALICRLGDRCAPFVPAGEAAQNLSLPRSGLVGLAFLCVLSREPVRPPAADVHQPEALADSPRLGQAPRLDRQWGNSPPGRVTGVVGGLVGDRTPHDRPLAVRPVSNSPCSSLPSAALATTRSSSCSTAVTSTPRCTSPAAAASAACRSDR